MRTFYKDASDVLSYTMNWASTLATSETISTSVMTPATGLTKDSESNTTTAATIWVSGGTDGTSYEVVNTITTNQGRTYQRTFRVKVTQL